MRVFCRFSGGRARRGRAFRLAAYRPAGEGLETKALLSAVLGWSGGNTDSAITPANISGFRNYGQEGVRGMMD